MAHTGPVTLTVLTNGPAPAEQLTDLVALGRERGSLSMADVAVALDRADLPPEAIDAAVRALAEEGVDVLDVPQEDDTDTEAEIRQASRGAAEAGRRAATSDDDPCQLRPARWRMLRRATAMMVLVGLCAPEVTKTEPSAT